jgi:hypothetical protein
MKVWRRTNYTRHRRCDLRCIDAGDGRPSLHSQDEADPWKRCIAYSQSDLITAQHDRNRNATFVVTLAKLRVPKKVRGCRTDSFIAVFER